MPKRVQIKSRSEIEKLPPDTVYCGRPSEYGNPYAPIDYVESVKNLTGYNDCNIGVIKRLVRLYCLLDYKKYLDNNPDLIERIRQQLRGKNLACFCSLDVDCHADVLLYIANDSNYQLDED